jgi:hypothetical protein
LQNRRIEAQFVPLATKLQATAPSGANELKRWDDHALRSFVERYRSKMEFGDPESKKSIVRALVASVSLDGDDLTLAPNYLGITGLRWRPHGDSNPGSHRERVVS